MKKKTSLRKKLSVFLLAILAPFVILAIIMTAWLVTSEIDNRQAKAFCERLVPALESFKTAEGYYPGDIDELPYDERRLPELLDSYDFYKSNGVRYRFVFPANDVIAGLWVYDSTSATWEFFQLALGELEEL